MRIGPNKRAGVVIAQVDEWTRRKGNTRVRELRLDVLRRIIAHQIKLALAYCVCKKR